MALDEAPESDPTLSPFFYGHSRAPKSVKDAEEDGDAAGGSAVDFIDVCRLIETSIQRLHARTMHAV